MLDHHWHPGQGEVNWWAVCRELEKLEAAPRLILELKDHAVQQAGAWFIERDLAL
jgi:hypothetical protein